MARARAGGPEGHGADAQGAESSLRTGFGDSAKLVSPPFPPGDILGETDATNLRYHNHTRICQAQAPRYPRENSIVSFLFLLYGRAGRKPDSEANYTLPPLESFPPSLPLPPSHPPRAPGLPTRTRSLLPFRARSSLPLSLPLSGYCHILCVSPLGPASTPPSVLLGHGSRLPWQVYVAVIWTQITTATPPFS